MVTKTLNENSDSESALALARSTWQGPQAGFNTSSDSVNDLTEAQAETCSDPQCGFVEVLLAIESACFDAVTVSGSFHFQTGPRDSPYSYEYSQITSFQVSRLRKCQWLARNKTAIGIPHLEIKSAPFRHPIS
jgi:hypothetical protein